MKKLIIILTLAMLVFFTACGNSGEVDEAFVGVWAWSVDGFFHYNFLEDGTGERVFPEFTETFEWGVSGETLFINRDNPGTGEIRNERWDFVMEDGVLDITSQHDETVSWRYYFMAEEFAEVLVGTWSWDGNHDRTITLSAEGTGRRGYAGEQEAFTWTSYNNIVHIYSRDARYGVHGEIWAFVITGDSLYLSSVQADDASYTYTRIG